MLAGEDFAGGMIKAALVVLLPVSALAGNLTTFWTTDGGYKMAREYTLPEGSCSTCAITRTWDGTTATTFAAKNETISLVFYLGAGGSAATSVNVAMSSFTGPGGAGIVAVSTTGPNVWNTTSRPYEVFIASYLPMIGITRLSWDSTEYEARDFPPRFRRPYTVNGNNQGVASSTWSARPDHDKFYPDVLIPNELFASSSFTVAANQSQAVWVDVYVSSTQTAGDYTATFTVREGVTVSTQIPVSLHVYNFILPGTSTIKSIVNTSGYNINWRHQNNKFDRLSAAERTTRMRYAQMFKRHKFSAMIGDDLTNDCSQTGKRFPCPGYVDQLSGLAYTAANGYGNASNVGIGDEIYSIGTYGGWDWSQTDSAAFCVAVSSWGYYFANNFPLVRSFVYLTDEPADLTNTNKWSTWMSTIPACQVAGYTVQSMVTANWTNVNTSATYLQLPMSTGWIGVSSTTWESVASSYTSRSNG